MKIVIIEDEKHNAARLQRILQEIDFNNQVVQILKTVTDSVAWFKSNPPPDVALLDVRLSDGLSFKIFSQVEIDCPIIFTTAYDEYAVRAFKLNSIDYLLKPIDNEELCTALAKLKLHQNKIQFTDLRQFAHLFNHRSPFFRKRFLLPHHNGFNTVSSEQVDYIYSESKVSHLVLQTGHEVIVQQTMDELEEELDPDIFFRANRQFIINVNSIENIYHSINGKLKVVLKKYKDKEIQISREKAPLFKAWLDW